MSKPPMKWTEEGALAPTPAIKHARRQLEWIAQRTQHPLIKDYTLKLNLKALTYFRVYSLIKVYWVLWGLSVQRSLTEEPQGPTLLLSSVLLWLTRS